MVVHAEHTTGGLVERLKQAAAEVIQGQRRELERNPRELRSVVIELPIQTTGATVRVGDQAECYVQRRVSVASALGVRSEPKGEAS